MYEKTTHNKYKFENFLNNQFSVSTSIIKGFSATIQQF